MVKQNKPEVKEKHYPYNNIQGTSFNSISFGSGTTMSLLATGIGQGTADGQRVGNRIKLIGIKIYFAIQNSALDQYNNVRFLLVRPKTDRVGVGDTLITSIMGGNVSSATQWASPVDTDRYKVYLDKSLNMYNRPADGSTSAVIVPTRFIKKFIKVRATMQWDDQGQLPKDFILVGISDSGSPSHPGVIAGHVVLYYTDA